MKNYVFTMLLFSGVILNAQNPKEQINEQVWKPFIRHFSEGNTDAFMALHSKHVIRFGLGGTPNPLDWETYREGQKRSDERDLLEKRKRTIDLRFEYRAAVDSFAYETGFYRTSYEQEGQPRQDYFGKFNVILKKEQGQWKILLDSDHGGVSEADFRKAQPLETTTLPKPSNAIRIMDFVKIKPEKEAEALFFYENNWKIYREKALEKGYISNYELIRVKGDEAVNFDFILMTEFPDAASLEKVEANFQPLMKELRPNGPVYLNELRQKDFIVSRFATDEGKVLIGAGR